MLQLLLNEFELRRQGEAVHLRVHLREGLREIRRSRNKPDIKAGIPNFDQLSKQYQERLENLLLEPASDAPWSFQDASFVFRYASGGVLPLLQWNSGRYYCLFYRDIDPVGWNIANGATDTPEELADPRITLEREFCEEFVVANPSDGRVFRLGCETPSIGTARNARRHWMSTLASRYGTPFVEDVLPVSWNKGPDSLTLVHGAVENVIPECFVNVNATDFGIELDRVALLSVHGEIVVCDGEILGERKINRPVGLFREERMQSLLSQHASRFEPDILFHAGAPKDTCRFQTVIMEEYIPGQFHYRTEPEQASFKRVCDLGLQYDLCPAARNILRRLGALPLRHSRDGR